MACHLRRAPRRRLTIRPRNVAKAPCASLASAYHGKGRPVTCSSQRCRKGGNQLSHGGIAPEGRLMKPCVRSWAHVPAKELSVAPSVMAKQPRRVSTAEASSYSSTVLPCLGNQNVRQNITVFLFGVRWLDTALVL